MEAKISVLRQVVDTFLLSQDGVTPEKLADSSVKMTELGLDSLGIVEMLFEVEDRYGIRIDDVMQFQQMTLGEVVAHMEQTVRNKHGGQLPEPAVADKAVT